MRRYSVVGLALWTALFWSPAADAEERMEAADTVVEDGAGGGGEDAPQARYAEELDVVEEQVERADSVTLVSREEIAEGHAAVAFDALDKKPGLFLRSRLGMTGAGLSRLAIRGNGAAGPAGLGVFIDGRPDSTVSFAHPTPAAHSLGSVESIEVIHGPSPVLYGSGNTGVVNITTRRPAEGWSGFVQAAAGTHDTTESFVRAGYGGERGFFRLDGTYRATDGHNPDSDARIAGLWLRAGTALGERWEVTAGAGRSDDHFSVFGPFFVPGPFANPGTEELDLTQTVADVVLRGRFDSWQTSLQLWYDDLSPESQSLRPGVRRAEVSESGLRYKARLRPGWADRVTVGVDLLTAEARNTPGLPPNRPEQDESITEVGPYVFVERSLGPRVDLAGGVRVVDHSEYGTEPVAELGLIFDLPGGGPAADSLRLRATRGYQSPTLQQLYGLFLGGQAGPASRALEPEQVNQYEVGYHRGGERLRFDVVAFLQEGSNLIQPTRGELQNSGTFSHPGIEASIDARLHDDVELGLGLTRLDLDEGILGIPETTIDLAVAYRPAAGSARDVSLTLLGRYAGEVLDQITPAAPVRRLDAYVVADAKLRARLAGDVYGFVEVDNLFDEEYQTVSTVPMPGRIVLVGFSASLGGTPAP